jgi:competence protein ComEC
MTLLFLVSVMFFVGTIMFLEDSRQYLTVSFLDVGQGDAIFIEAPNGNQMLIDAGINKKVLRELGKAMPFYDRSIDVVMETHPDADHIGGMPPVLGNYNIGVYVKTKLDRGTDISNAISGVILEKELEVDNVFTGDIIMLDYENDIYIEILHPYINFESKVVNDWSIVARLVYGDIEFLFTGDATEKVEEILISKGGIESDILKVGHHGSKTSSSFDFLGLVNPDVGIISAGFENRYGHPHEEVVDRLKEFDIEILDTKELTTIVVSSDGDQYWIGD